ncbi:YitT family protein [Anaerocolumna xylanovorans]|uniref:Uncharacterized membrane-anchored protein YitT, contains DUF161 and DUF2179 domains n=1 Tax=Anaerocolumna xylanovorans DSM 12503 TaxID=1121345 RepID=A0A1M7YFV5_9FIRM|nr:YitT family protein [Anaerocolumna xylanovorans]SHO51500.1 Uncharacterized membrane-anchored protein YitT, contains DUF161 and DUF2179 domains [Anaerocolumna xylanovorans DSM 12503]
MLFSKNKKRLLTTGKMAAILLGTAISSFGIYNIHRQTHITEGGVLGLILLLNNWTGISPSLLTPILDILCYGFAFRYLGKDFIKISLVSTLCLAGFFKLWEQFPPVLPNLSSYPLAAAIAGGLFVGIGVGLIIRQGASSGGDDALALILSKLLHCRISRVYLATDITVLGLSLTYISLNRIAYSLVTVIISSLLIEYVQNAGKKVKPETDAEPVAAEEDIVEIADAKL